VRGIYLANSTTIYAATIVDELDYTRDLSSGAQAALELTGFRA
jgi:hypothetical protein